MVAPAGLRACGSVWYVPSSMAWSQGSRRAGVPQAAVEVLELRSEAHDAGQSGLTRAAPGGTAVVGAFIVGAGLIIAVLLGDLVLGASLRGVVLTAANLVTAAVEEAAVMVAVLTGAFLAYK